MPLRWTEEELEAWKREKEDAAANPYLPGPTPKARHKYQANPTVDPDDGIRFDSMLEARYYRLCKLRQAAGDLVGFLRQVPIHLPGKTKLVIDFLEFRADGSAVFVDTKGVQTETFRLKVRQVQELYPWIQLEIVTKAELKGIDDWAAALGRS